LPGIRGIRIAITDVTAKFKYGGNVDAEHRAAVAQRLADRAGPGDAAARQQLLRRSAADL
jgi:transcriptional regulator